MKLLPHILQERAQSHAEKRAYTFLIDGESQEKTLTYHQLFQEAQAIASHLQQNFKIGDRILLLFPPGTEFVSAFWACLLAGMIAVPVHPPWDKRTQKRFLALTKDSAPVAALSTTEVIKKAFWGRILVGSLRKIKWLAVDDLSSEYTWKLPDIHSATPALIQYTSGSTGTAKGVLVSHGNLYHNTQLLQAPINEGIQEKGNLPDSFVCWLPIYHDMGLMTSVIFPVVLGAPCSAMSPLMFLQQPLRWLKAMTKYQATISVAPNFGYELCLKRVNDNELHSLDLSHWSAALNGAEFLRVETLKRFVQKFEVCGFRYEAFYPCYGLAESTVFVTGGQRYKEPVVIHLDKDKLQNNQVELAKPDDANCLTLISVGQVWLDETICIVEPMSLKQLKDLQIGEIWLSSPSVSQGYWQRAEENQTSFNWQLEEREGKFLRTGDLGFLHQGQVYITGRIKDLVIIRGRNHYPQHIEQTITEAHHDLRKGCGAAFSIEGKGGEQLVVVQEVKKTAQTRDAEEFISVIRQAISEEHGIPVFDIVLIEHGTILKTSSGKIQRSRVKRDYQAKKLKRWKP